MLLVLKKKIIGTAIYLGLLLVAIGAAAGVQAKFLNTARIMNFEGIVTNKAGLELIVHATGSADVVVMVEPGKTIIGGDASSYADIMPGDGVTVMGVREGNAVTARVLKKVAGAGYGTQGPAVMLSHGTVVAKGASSFSIDIGAAVVTVQVSISTNFNGGSFGTLALGQTVSVIGRDTGTSVIATTVTFN